MSTIGRLEEWCWQSTVCFAALLYGDDDGVARGYLDLAGENNYYHAWVEFGYEGNLYVFDPSLSLLTLKSEYYRSMNVKVIAKVSSSNIRVALYGRHDLQAKKSAYEEDPVSPIRGVYIPGDDNPEAPLYRVNSKILVDVDGRKKKIKKMTSRFFYNG
jgi:hypothetical protein